MDKLLILENFHVYVADGFQADGKQKPDKRVALTKGMTLSPDQLPAGQSAADWVEKGLAKAVEKAAERATAKVAG